MNVYNNLHTLEHLNLRKIEIVVAVTEIPERNMRSKCLIPLNILESNAENQTKRLTDDNSNNVLR